MPRIDVAKIKESINALLDLVIESGITNFELEDRYYWEVETTQRYNMQNKPGPLILGDLFDDLEFVDAVLSRKEGAVPYTLTQAAPLLMYIGELVSDRLLSNEEQRRRT